MQQITTITTDYNAPFFITRKLFERYEIDSDVSNDVAMHVWCLRYSRYDPLPFSEKRECLSHDLSLTKKTIVAHQILCF